MRQLTGLSRDHLLPFSDDIWLHREAVAPFRRLQAAAAREGIDLTIASGFRDFGRQLTLWNRKAAGERPVLSADGAVSLDIERLSERELMYAILRWSALPGASRHHWGTDVDVWDAAAVAPEYRLQLTPDEYSERGPFASLNRWLGSGVLEEMGFYRPYDRDRGGVSPEAWHISYRTLAQGFSEYFDFRQLAGHLATADIRLKGEILANLDDIAQRFFYR